MNIQISGVMTLQHLRQFISPVSVDHFKTILIHYYKWILDPGSRILDTGYRILDTGYWNQDTGYRIPDTGYRILDTGYRIQDIE